MKDLFLLRDLTVKEEHLDFAFACFLFGKGIGVKDYFDLDTSEINDLENAFAEFTFNYFEDTEFSPAGDVH